MGHSFPEAEQRTETRLPVASDAAVDVLGEPGYSLVAEVVDVSSRGMRLATSAPLAVDAALRICVEGDLYLGEVTHCTARDGRYFVGVSLFNVIRNIAEVTDRMGRLVSTR
jgi:hypothetical protein